MDATFLKELFFQYGTGVILFGGVIAGILLLIVRRRAEVGSKRSLALVGAVACFGAAALMLLLELSMGVMVTKQG